MPSNAPALVFYPAVGWVPQAVADYQIEVRDQDDTVVPVTLEAEGRGHLIRPMRPLRGMALKVRARNFCTSFPSIMEQTIPLTPPSPLPTAIGTARLREEARFSAGLPRCLPASVHMVVDVTMTPEMQAYRPVSRWDITYRGKTTRVEYGDLQSSLEVAYVLLEDTCGPDTETVGGPLTIAAHVAGAGSDPPPLEVTISSRCPYYGTEKMPPPCSSVDAGEPSHPEPPVTDAGPAGPGPTIDGPGVGADPSPPPAGLDAGAPTDSAAPGTRARSGGGCSLLRADSGARGDRQDARSAPTSIVPVVLVWGLCLGRRRRRMPRSQLDDS